MTENEKLIARFELAKEAIDRQIALVKAGPTDLSALVGPPEDDDPLDLAPCPDCGACPAETRCQCDFAGLRVQRRIAELESQLSSASEKIAALKGALGGDTKVEKVSTTLDWCERVVVQDNDLRLRIAELEQDRERLEWLFASVSREPLTTAWVMPALKRDGWVAFNERGDIFRATSPREAIDAARKR